MRILFIPLDTFRAETNESTPNRIRLLSGKNRVIGVERAAPFTDGLPEITTYLKFLMYSIRVFFFGLRYRRDYDLIYCFESAYTLVGLGISQLTGKPCVRDCAGATWEWLYRVKPPLFLRLAISLSEKIIRRLARMHIVLSDADRSGYIEHGYEPDKVVSIPRPADFRLADAVSGDKSEVRAGLHLDASQKILIFSGRRDYPPNMEAAEWIIRSLAPALTPRLNGIRILMTGAGKQPVATHPIVTLTGFVPDLFEYIHASDVFVAPIEMPSGRLTKVFDSLSCGTPTVVLASAVNGIPELVDGENVMIAGDREEFIEKAVYLLENPDIAREIGLRGRKMLEEHYGWDLWEERLSRALQSCLANTGRRSSL